MIKAHEFFTSEVKLTNEVKEKIGRYSHLVGKKVEAIPTDEGFEKETFTVVGLIPKPYTTKIYCILKSEECDLAVEVEADAIGKTMKSFAVNPGFVLELKKE